MPGCTWSRDERSRSFSCLHRGVRASITASPQVGLAHLPFAVGSAGARAGRSRRRGGLERGRGRDRDDGRAALWAIWGRARFVIEDGRARCPSSRGGELGQGRGTARGATIRGRSGADLRPRRSRPGERLRCAEAGAHSAGLAGSGLGGRARGRGRRGCRAADARVLRAQAFLVALDLAPSGAAGPRAEDDAGAQQVRLDGQGLAGAAFGVEEPFLGEVQRRHAAEAGAVVGGLGEGLAVRLLGRLEVAAGLGDPAEHVPRGALAGSRRWACSNRPRASSVLPRCSSKKASRHQLAGAISRARASPLAPRCGASKPSHSASTRARGGSARRPRRRARRGRSSSGPREALSRWPGRGVSPSTTGRAALTAVSSASELAVALDQAGEAGAEAGQLGGDGDEVGESAGSLSRPRGLKLAHLGDHAAGGLDVVGEADEVDVEGRAPGPAGARRRGRPRPWPATAPGASRVRLAAGELLLDPGLLALEARIAGEAHCTPNQQATPAPASSSSSSAIAAGGAAAPTGLRTMSRWTGASAASRRSWASSVPAGPEGAPRRGRYRSCSRPGRPACCQAAAGALSADHRCGPPQG